MPAYKLDRARTFVADLVVAVNVHLSQQLVHLVVLELLPKMHQHVPQLLGVDVAVAVLVEDAEGVQQTVTALHGRRLALDNALQVFHRE